MRTAAAALIEKTASKETTVRRLWKEEQKHFRLPKHSYNTGRRIWNGSGRTMESCLGQTGAYFQSLVRQPPHMPMGFSFSAGKLRHGI